MVMKKTKSQLQMLVNEHYMFGMDSNEIREHLCTKHSIDRDTFIPPVSNSVKKDRNRFLETGVMPAWFVRLSVKSTKEDINNNPDPEFKPVFKNYPTANGQHVEMTIEERMQSAMDVINKKYNVNGKCNVRSMSLEDREIVSAYNHSHPTSLDRWFFHEMAYFINSVSQEGSIIITNDILKKRNINISPFVAFEHCIQRRVDILRRLGYEDVISVARLTHNKAESVEGLHEESAPIYSDVLKQLTDVERVYVDGIQISQEMMMLGEWLVGVNKQKNIQISFSDCEDILSSRELANQDEWRGIANEMRVFIDVKHKVKGERYISGVFSRPLPCGDIEYTAFVEWSQTAFEASITWSGDNLHEDNIVIITYNEGSVASEFIIEEYQEVAAFALRIHKTVLNADIQSLLNKSGTSKLINDIDKQGLFNGEKQSVRGKSLFLVDKKEIKNAYRSDKHGFRKSWKLDSIIGVSGHWRKQPHGEGRKKLKIIWIDPYTKGVGMIETRLDKAVIEIKHLNKKSHEATVIKDKAF